MRHVEVMDRQFQNKERPIRNSSNCVSLSPVWTNGCALGIDCVEK